MVRDSWVLSQFIGFGPMCSSACMQDGTLKREVQMNNPRCFTTTLTANLRLATSAAALTRPTMLMLMVFAGTVQTTPPMYDAMIPAVTEAAKLLPFALKKDNCDLKAAVLSLAGNDHGRAARILGIDKELFANILVATRYPLHTAIERTLKKIPDAQMLGAFAQFISETEIGVAHGAIYSALIERATRLGTLREDTRVRLAAAALNGSNLELSQIFTMSENEIRALRDTLESQLEESARALPRTRDRAPHLVRAPMIVQEARTAI